MLVHCLYQTMEPVLLLKPHAKNPNRHSTQQIEAIAKVLSYAGWRAPIIVSKLSGFVVAGHGRLEAAKLNGWEKVPVNYQDFESEDAEYQHMVADNSLQGWSELDFSMINSQLAEFDPKFDLDLLGIKNFTLDPPILESEPEKPKTKKSKQVTCPNCSHTWGGDA